MNEQRSHTTNGSLPSAPQTARCPCCGLQVQLKPSELSGRLLISKHEPSKFYTKGCPGSAPESVTDEDVSK